MKRGMADSGRYIWKWSKKKIERKKKKEKIKYPKSKKKTLGKWSALLISESIERKTGFHLTRQDMAGYDGCLNIKKKILSRHSSQTAHAKLIDR